MDVTFQPTFMAMPHRVLIGRQGLPFSLDLEPTCAMFWEKAGRRDWQGTLRIEMGFEGCHSVGMDSESNIYGGESKRSRNEETSWISGSYKTNLHVQTALESGLEYGRPAALHYESGVLCVSHGSEAGMTDDIGIPGKAFEDIWDERQFENEL